MDSKEICKQVMEDIIQKSVSKMRLYASCTGSACVKFTPNGVEVSSPYDLSETEMDTVMEQIRAQDIEKGI